MAEATRLVPAPPPARTWVEKVRRHAFTVGVPLVMAMDVGLIFAVFAGVYAARFVWRILSPVNQAPPWTPYWHAAVLVAMIYVAGFALLGLYRVRRAASKFEDMVVLGFGLVTGTVVALALSFFYRDFTYSRLLLLYGLVGSFVGLGAFHLVLRSLQEALQARGWGLLNTVIVGCNPLGELVSRRFDEAPHLGHRLLGFVQADNEVLEHAHWVCRVSTTELRPVAVEACAPLLGHEDELGALIERHRVDEVILARPGATFSQILDLKDKAAARRRVRLRIVPDLQETRTAKIRVSELDGIPTLEIGEVPLRKWHNRALKRTMDLTCALLGLLVSLPVVGVAAIAIKLTSPGPIFYRQVRMGRDERPFNIYKLRTMYVDAEERTGPVWAKAGDPRATPVGGLLRRLSLDELPQFWNVLVGDMSMVGPRPERPIFVEGFKGNVTKYGDRHLVKSGLTGWAQVNGLRGEEGTIEERTRYDLYYIENWSLLFDLRIMVKTALEVLFYRAH